jgi:hypothetical protein
MEATLRLIVWASVVAGASVAAAIAIGLLLGSL